MVAQGYLQLEYVVLRSDVDFTGARSVNGHINFQIISVNKV